MTCITDQLNKGDGVRFRKRGGRLWESGYVELIWMALDEPCVSVVTNDGGSIAIFPGLDDEIELLTVAASAGRGGEGAEHA